MSAAPAPVEPAVRSAPAPRTAPTPNVQATQFRSFGEFTRAVALGQLQGEQQARYFRALDAAVSGTDATGLVTEQWINQVGDLVRQFTPSLNSWNRVPLPTEGMTMSAPLVTVAPTVAVQATQNTEVESTALTVTDVSYAIKTYAAGQNTSIQTIQRSTPAYLQVLMAQYVKYMAKAVNLAVATQLLVDADDVNTTSLEYTTAAVFDELIIDASAVFLDSLGSPAQVLGMSVDLWKALAKAKTSNGDPLYPSVNPMNRGGQMSATRTNGQIVEVDWYVDPDLGGVGDGITGAIGVREAFNIATGPMGTLNADVPSTLGRDTAVYQMAAFGKLDATGLYKIVDAV
jgi:HK97 family phage major capsid protein